MIFSFDGYEIDTDQLELRHEQTPVHVEPQVFDVLCHLIRHRDRVVTKLELFDEIWGGAFVGEATLTSRIKTARQAVGDNGQAQRLIRTIHRRGYQFVGDVLERQAPRSVAGSSAGVPTGTVTFLFSDIEGSSRLWELHPELMPDVIGRHDDVLGTAVATHGGVVFATAGDGLAAVFVRASDALDAARAIRSALDAEPWPEPVDLRVRLGIHTGEAIERDGDYLGGAVNRAARVMAAAHGGQTLVSDVTATIVGSDAGLIDLGMCRVDPAMAALRLWQVDAGSFPPLAGAVSASLPTLRTEMIGREPDLERVSDAIAESRLVSIVGPGGAGKTTLALAAANAALVSFPTGVVFVELASVNDGGGIHRAVAAAAGIEGAAAADTHSLAIHLARRPVLLVLDNCEHLLDESAEFIDSVLDAGSEATILTTTREPHGVDGEVIVPLGSLDAAAPHLFVERARSASGVDLAADDPRIGHICHRLDGLPLAIELAAAQLRHLGMDDLVAHLDASLDLGHRGRSRGRERHMTLERTIAWSYELLDEGGRHLLRQFGVFPGSFDLAAAEAVGRADGGPSILTTLSDLMAKSLMVRDVTTGRYRLLETIRAFAGQRLADAGETDGAAERLRRHVIERATSSTRLERWLSGQRAAALRADLDNVRFAFDRSMWTGQTVDALEIHIAASFLFRNTMSCTDGRRWAARLELSEAELDPIDRLWSNLVRADVAQGTADHAHNAAVSALAIELAAGVDDAVAVALAQQAHALQHVVRAPDHALELLSAPHGRASAVGDARLARLLRAFAAVTELAAGRIDVGTEMAEAVGHEVDGDGYDVFIANWAAWTACLISRDAERLRYWRERQRAYLNRVDVPEPWMFLWSTALNLAMEGDDPMNGLREARQRADGEGHDIAADIVLALAVIEDLRGDPEEAAALLGTAMRHPLNNLSHYVLARAVRETLREKLGPDAVAAALAVGAAHHPARRRRLGSRLITVNR